MDLFPLSLGAVNSQSHGRKYFSLHSLTSALLGQSHGLAGERPTGLAEQRFSESSGDNYSYFGMSYTHMYNETKLIAGQKHEGRHFFKSWKK